MKAYTYFSSVYDELMDNIPYDKWFKYLHSLLLEKGIRDGIVAELGCGSGRMTRLLADAGYDMIGIDSSSDMLEAAMNNDDAINSKILYINQDMRKMELFGTVSAFVSVGDSINYITDKKDLVKIFRLCNNYLDAGGYLIFDLKTKYMYSHLMGNRTITDNRDNVTLIWDNRFDNNRKINEYNLTIYNKSDIVSPSGDSLYTRFEETHHQRAYSVLEIKKALNEAGMEFIAVYDAFTHDRVKPNSERMYVVAREKFQKGKKYI
jgi:ubiquinone/menaquinone biosynthesis C-methylase UbiE